jgi:anti-anti-sigma factor
MTVIDPGIPQAIVVSDGEGLRVELTGELDLAARAQLDDLLAKITSAPPCAVVIDLSAVTFLSSDALGFLAQIRNHADSGGHEVTLAGPDRVALRALQVSGFDRVFRIIP